MNAHIPTIFLMILLVSATLAVAVGVVAQRDQKDGLFLWAAALVAHTAAYALISLRGTTPDFASIVLANGLLSATFALYGEALCQFQQRRPPRVWLWLPVAVTLVLFAWLMNAPPARMLAGPVIYAVQSIVLLVVLYRAYGATAGRGKHFMAFGLLAMQPVFVARVVHLLRGDSEIVQLTAATPLQTLTFLVTAASVVVITLGFVLMIKEHADVRSRALAMVDDLTGLPNRRCTLQGFDQQMAQALRTRQPLAVLMIDIDHFKRINDSLGHLVGDAVLRHVAQGIRRRLRAQDLSGRFGGEEFLAVLPDTGIEGGQRLAEALRAGLAADPYITDNGEVVSATISIGVAAVDPRVDASLQGEALIGAADAAMYAAKNAGRNQVRVATAPSAG